MSASQISFSDFALSQCPWCGATGPDFAESPAPSDYCGHDLATVCAPPAIDTAVAVVAHPLAVDSGECVPVGAVLSGRFGCSSELRDDFLHGFMGDGLIGSVSGAGMDAPPHIPSGSHRSYVCGAGYSWSWLVVDGCSASRGVGV